MIDTCGTLSEGVPNDTTELREEADPQRGFTGHNYQKYSFFLNVIVVIYMNVKITSYSFS